MPGLIAKNIMDRLNKLKKRSGDIVSLQPDKIYNFRLVPGQKDIFHEMYFHYSVGKEFSLLCPSTHGDRCPICEVVSELYASGDNDYREQANKLRAKLRVFIPVLIRGQEKNMSDEYWPRYWGVPSQSYERILTLVHRYLHKNNVDISDPIKGRDFIVETESRKIGERTVTVVKNIDVDTPSALADSKEEIMAIINKIPDTDKLFELKSYDELKDILKEYGGMGGERESDKSQLSESKPENDENPKFSLDDDETDNAKSETDNTKSETDNAKSETDSEGEDDSINEKFNELFGA